MGKHLNLIGMRFNHLTVIEQDYSHHKGKKQRWWLCKCDCGKTTRVNTTDLTSGHTKSCGCFQRSQASSSLIQIKKRNVNFHLSKTKTYRCWRAMMSRCYNPHTKYYKYYGGRGIGVDTPWHEYRNFLSDMGEAGDKDTLDRIDCNGNYSKSNCRWASMKQQNNNRRNNIFLYVGNLKFSMKEFAEAFELPYHRVIQMTKDMSMSGEEILSLLKF